MGYIILSPEYIKSESGDNWHLFKAKKYKGKADLYQKMREIGYGKEEYSVKIIDDDCLPERKEEVKLIKCIEISSEYYKSISIEYDLKQEKIKYNNLIEKLEYFTDENQTLFYSDNEDTIRMLACLLGRKVCGRCMAKLYGDNKKRSRNDLGFKFLRFSAYEFI